MAVNEDHTWRTTAFRQSVVTKIDEAIRQSGMPTARNSMEMESHVFNKAKTKEEYLGFVARLILHVREMNSKKAAMGGAGAGPVMQGVAGMPDPINALQTLARQGVPNGPSKPRQQVVVQVLSTSIKGTSKTSIPIVKESSSPKDQHTSKSEESKNDKASVTGKVIWQRPETRFLIDAYTRMKKENAVNSSGTSSEKEIFEKISKELKDLGHKYTWEMCQTKCQTLVRTYRAHQRRIKNSGYRAAKWEFFERMHEVMGNDREFEPISTASSTGKETKRGTTNSSSDSDSSGDKQTRRPVRAKRSCDRDSFLKWCDEKFAEKERRKDERHREKMAVKTEANKVLKEYLEVKRQSLHCKDNVA